MPWMRFYMERRIIKRYIIFICIATLCACSSKAPNENKVQDEYEYSVTPSNYAPQTANKHWGSTSPTTPSTPANYSSSTIDRYEEGLLDGEAAAEEDRLAGRPGMQVGDDDDDEDYDNGYDDGYDE